MRTPRDERSQSTAAPNVSFLNATQTADIPDSFFFDPPTDDLSLANTQGPNPSLLSAIGTEGGEEQNTPETSLGTAPHTSGGDSFCRRGQAYRRANASGATSRVRSLEGVAATMKADVEAAGHAASSSSSATAALPPPSALTRAALAELQGKPGASYKDEKRAAEGRGGGLPVLHTADGAEGSRRESGELASFPVRSGERAEGSVHVATRASRRGESVGSLSALHAGPGLEFDSGFELSMENVTFTASQRRYLRLHPIPYLDDCSLHIAPGSMHCIASLNPSYARAALAVLAGVDTASTATGAALANAFPTSSLRYRQQVAYVSSLDCCTEESTVYENLAFATRIRFLVDDATLREVVEQAASDVFLMDHLHTRASDLGPARRYLLATAMELVAEPTVLLLEDPLSFFCLAELQMFTMLLHSMRRRNPARTVVWSGSTIPWTLFDHIESLTLLTTGGKTFYTGGRKGVQTFLQADLGILRVPGEDVMDIMAQTEVDAVAVTHATICFHQSKFYREVLHDIEAHRTRIAANAFASSPEPPRPQPSYASVQGLLILYTLRRNVLGKAALVPWAGLVAVMLLICILVAVADGKQGKNVQNTCGVLFLLLSCSVQINSIFMKTELREWRTFLSFRNNQYFPVSTYYVATMVRLLVPRLCVALVSACAGALIFSTGTALSLSALLSLLSFSHACLGLIAVYWFPRLEVLMVANHLYYAYCVIFCGYVISVQRVPLFFQLLSLLRVAYGGALAGEIKDLTWCDNASSAAISDDSAFTPDCFSGKSYLALMGLQNDGLGQSALALSLMALALMGAMLLSMHLSPSSKLFSSS